MSAHVSLPHASPGKRKLSAKAWPVIVSLWVLGVTGCLQDAQQEARQRYQNAWNEAVLPEPIADPAAELEILIWRDYFPAELFTAFAEIYGVEVKPTFFDNNEQMREMYYAEPTRWDLLMPSDYMVSILRREGQLDRLQQDRLSHMSDLAPRLFALDCDPGLHFFAPYFYSALGISFDVQYIGGFPRSWQFLTSQVNNPFVPGRIAFGNQPRFVLGFALMSLGFDPNSADPDEIAQARDYLITLVEQYGAQVVGDELLEERNWEPHVLIVQWSGTAAFLLSLDLDYRFLIPEGPSIVAIDGFVIPRGSTHKATAHLLLDFLMTPEVFARAADYSFYAPSSRVAERRISNFVLHGPSLLLPEQGNLTTLLDVGPAEQYYLDAWEEVLAAEPREGLQVIPLPVY